MFQIVVFFMLSVLFNIENTFMKAAGSLLLFCFIYFFCFQNKKPALTIPISDPEPLESSEEDFYFSVKSLQKQHSTEKMNIKDAQHPFRPNIVFFTGAGISAPSGVPTYRDAGSEWNSDENTVLSSCKAIESDLTRFLAFHNKRRAEMLRAKPNAAHLAIAELQSCTPTTVITQNIDDLHERSGTELVVHLHGSILAKRSSEEPSERQLWLKDIKVGDLCPKTKSQYRPDIVLFGEQPVNMRLARAELCKADVVVVVGSSLQVQPAAAILETIHPDASVFYINLVAMKNNELPFRGKQLIGDATEIIPELVRLIKLQYNLGSEDQL